MSTLAFVVGALGLAISIVALAVAAGTAARLERFEAARRMPDHIGLPAGAAVAPSAFDRVLSAEQAARLVEGPSLVLFVSPQCAPCRSLVENAPAELAPGWVLAAVEPDGTSDGDSLRHRGQLTDLWLVDAGGKIKGAFDTAATPHAFFVQHGRVIDQVVGPGVDDVRTHLASLGSPAPAF